MEVKSYSKSAKYYDLLLGNQSDKASLIKSWIKKYNPNATSILEIACGTGEILKLLENDYEVYGLDISKEMLMAARQKLKRGRFYLEDMSNFSLNKKFDIILSIYDSINHLSTLSDWRKTFKNSAAHLNPKGLLIFDVNTLAKFDGLAKAKNPYVTEFGKDLIVDKARKIGKNRLVFYTRIFEHQRNNNYKLFEENVEEIAFEKETLRGLLNTDFKILTIIDPDRKSPSKKSRRLYFICRLK